VTKRRQSGSEPRAEHKRIVVDGDGPDANHGGLPPAPGQLVAGVFRVDSLLGVGAGGSVYKVTETDSERVRALKIFAQSSDREQTLHEFRVLARLRHPGCVRVHAFGSDASFGPYLVMDLVEGSAPTDVLARGETAPLLEFVRQILETLAYLHDRGIAHGDLKPGNIRCINGDPAHPVLLDFGLASTHHGTSSGGTVLYMAPEIFRRQPRTARTDLYALGVMIYEIVTGSPPYTGATDLQITRGHLGGNAAPLATRRKVSDALSRLVGRLMAREPGNRPVSAHEALALLAELTGRDLVTSSPVLDAGMVISAPALVQREPVVASFDELFSHAGSGTGGLLLVHGPPGSGHTRIADELEIRTRLRGGRLVRWDPTAKGISTAVSEALRALLSEHTSENLSGLLDGLRRLQRIENTSVEMAGRERSLDRVADVALDVLFTASRRAPLVVLVDNVQAARAHDTAFIGHLARGIARSRIVVVACCDTADAVPSDALDPDLVRIEELTPLGEAAIETFVRTALGALDDPHHLATWLATESAGTPSMLMELLRWLVESGLLARQKGQWHLTGSLDRPAEDPSSAAESIAKRRLAGVNVEGRRFLKAAAVMGMCFDPNLAADGAGRGAPDDDLLAALLRSRIVALSDASPWRLRFSQTALRTVLVNSVPPEQRRGVHQHIASKLMARNPGGGADGLAERGVLAETARHLLGAGDWQSGVPLARNAAERSRRTLAFGEAETLYKLALEALENQGTDSVRCIILRDLGDLHMEADRPVEARQHFAKALARCGKSDPIDVRRRLGHALVLLAEYAEAIKLLAKVVGDAKMGTESRVLAAHDIGWAYMLQSDWRAALTAADGAGRLARRHGDRRYEAKIRKLRGNILWQQGRWDASLQENEAALAIYESLSDANGAAEALMAMGTGHRHLAQYSDAIRCYERALSRFEEMGYRRGVGKCQNNLGIVYYYQGDWPAATRCFEAFMRILERTGERIERVSLLNNLGSLYRERGMFERAEQLLSEGLHAARELGAKRLEAMLLGNLGDTMMRAGRHPQARSMLKKTVQLAEAIEAKDEAIEGQRRMFELDSLENAHNIDNRAVQKLLDRADDAKLRLEVANLLRLLAMDNRINGRYTAAAECLDRAEGELAGAGAALELARVRRERGLTLGAQGESAAAQRVLQEVERTFERMDAGWDLAMTREAQRRVRMGPEAGTTADQLEAIAAFCEQIGHFEDPRDFLSTVLERMVDLVSADRGFIVLFDAAGRPSLKVVCRRDNSVTRPADKVFSRTITRDAYQSDEPIYIPLTVAAERYKAAQSIALMEVRSVLAASIRSHRRRRGVLYLDSVKPDSEELRRAVPLVGALSSVIGASLEHAELLELERSRSETMAMLAHELRGPLNGIYAHVELMREHTGALPGELSEYLEVASDELLRLNRMIGNLTDLARLEHHQSANTVVSIDMRELLSTVAANLSGLSTSRRQKIQVHTPDALPMVLGSRDRIIQVVTNLLTNAIKFTPDEGHIHLRARSIHKDAPVEDLGPECPPTEFLSQVSAHVSESGFVEIAIEDSGPGVPEETRETIFTKFRQGGGRQSRRRGLGLGLAIARHIVERHGGHIWCDNLEQGGAAFKFTLPTLEEPQAE